MRRTVPLLLVVVLIAPLGAADPPKADLAKGVELVGRAEAPVVVIRPRVSGFLERVPVKEGAAVKKGDLLAEVDDRPYKIKLDAAKAKLLTVSALLRLAEANLAQDKVAHMQKAISDFQINQDEANVAQAAAAVSAEKAVVAQAELELSWTKLTAPVDGRAGRLLLSPGDLVTADKSEVLTVVATEPLAVTFGLDELTTLGFVRAVRAGGKPLVEVGLLDEEGFPRKAVLESSAVTVNPETGAARFRATLADPNTLILPGMALRVRLTVSPK
jgi:RND family efflux transporter MFP subunit